MKAMRDGKSIISFKDGSIYTVKDPYIEISGLTYGEFMFNFTEHFVVKDMINKMESKIVYNPGKTKGLMKSFSKLWSK